MLVLSGDGHIKQRLVSAYAENIDGMSEDDLPGELQKNFLDLKNELHSVPPLNGEGAVCATVRKMSVEEASACAEKLLALYSALVALRDAQEDQLAVGDTPVLVKSVG